MNTSRLPETTLVHTLRAEYTNVLWLRSNEGHQAVERIADQADQLARELDRGPFGDVELRVLWTGSRKWAGEDGRAVAPVVHAALVGLMRTGPLTNLHGSALGLDLLVNELSAKLGAAVQGFPVSREEQDRWGYRFAPLKRNERMVTQGRAHLCIGVPHPRQVSNGTWHCLRSAASHGLTTKWVEFPENLMIATNLVGGNFR